jgi:hypothetical protein
MLPLIACLLALQAQPAEIDWNPKPAPEPAAKAEPTFEEALAASYAAEDKGRLGFKIAPPQTEEERIAAANAAAIARAEQAAKDANATTPWPDQGKMRCKSTESGFVCGNSDKALEPDSPSRQALDGLLNKPN